MALTGKLRADNDYIFPDRQAHELAGRMPALLVEASRIATTLTHGIHGRKRHGPGETFWQFRHYEQSDDARNIDWRRSATSSHLFVREREWEAAHTVWLWPDLSPSMNFSSHLAKTPKIERALVLVMAMAELLSKAGERIAIPELLPPTSAHNAAQKLARSISSHLDHQTFQNFPASRQMKRHSEVILISDFLDPAQKVVSAIERLAMLGVRGHLVQILDPAEETLPYEGRVMFESMDGGTSVLAGRAQELRVEYQRRLSLHRQEIKQAAHRHRFSWLLHHSDRPASEALLALHSRLGTSKNDYPNSGGTS